MKLKLSWPKVLIWLTYITVFIFLIYPYSDLDWGWHFRYGEYFIKTGQVLRDNLYTWTLANYKWANSSWFYDVILYVSYTTTGFTGLSVVGAIVGIIIFLIPTINSKLNYLFLGLIGLFFVKLSEEALDQGLRGQSIGLLFLCLLSTILIIALKKPKVLFSIPPLILIWVNLNGTFSLGMLILGIFIATNIFIRVVNRIRHKPNIDILNLKTLILVFFLSVAASFVNPFTYGVYIEGLKHFFSVWLTNVIEWIPPSFACPNCNYLYFLIFPVILTVLFAVRKKLSDLPYIVTLLFLTIEGFLHRRYVPMLVATSLPVVVTATTELKFNFDKIKLTKIIYSLVLVILMFFGLFIVLPKYQLNNYTFNNYCYHSSECSPGLADFLLKNPPLGRGFNFYDWGGFLIGRGVNAKLFIDGRMQLWDDNGNMPFADFIKIYYYQDANIFNGYNFDWVIVRNDSSLSKTLLTPNIFWGAWKRVYFDQNASYFVRVKI